MAQKIINTYTEVPKDMTMENTEKSVKKIMQDGEKIQDTCNWSPQKGRRKYMGKNTHLKM